MHKKTFAHIHFTAKTFIIAIIIALSGVFYYQTAGAESTVAYCKKFTVTSENYACNDGWSGKDCEDYLYTHDERHRNICVEAGSVKESGEGTDDGGDTDGDGDDTPENEEKSEAETKSDEKKDEQLQKTIDDLKELNKALGGQDKQDPDKVADNNYGQYVNGVGKLQQLRIGGRHEGSPRPAIIFINGGGWHTDDGTGDRIAPAAQERGYTTFVATYRLGSSGIYYQLEDVMRAIKHVRNNAAMYNIDPSRIAIWGDSAGGSLAMRAAATGKSGVAAAVGWSAPTNAYTALFKSARAFAIGMDHSTCVPTDAAGAINTIDQLAGGEGNVVENEGGIGNNSSGDGALGTAIGVLELAQKAKDTGKNVEKISKDLESEEGKKELGENVRRLAAKKFLECIDNFNSASPALFASGLTPPSFLAGFDSDPLIDPGQAYQMRDKLRSLGVASDTLVLPGVVGNAADTAIGNQVDGENHLGYNEKFEKPSLDFLDRFIRPN